MARTATEIYNAAIAQKEATPELAALTSTSKTALWRLWLWLVTFVAATHEKLWDEYAADIEAKGRAALAGTIAWYRSRVMEFQDGDTLEFIDNVYQYEVVDEVKRIVKFCAISEVDGGIYIKVAASDVGGNPVIIEGASLSNLDSYLSFIKFAGTKHSLISLTADKVLMDLKIYYSGVSYSEVSANVFAAIVSYLSTLSTKHFNGALKKSALIAAIMDVEGVDDAYFSLLHSQQGVNTAVAIDRETIAASGYWQLDGGNEISTTDNNTDGSITTATAGNVSITYIVS